MIEATYTEKMRVNAPFSADMVSFVWSGVGLFGLVGIFVAGPGIDWFGPIALLAGAIPFSALIIYPAVRGWLTETRIPPEQRGRSTLDGLRQQWHYFTITVLLTVCVVTTMLSGIMQVWRFPTSSARLGCWSLHRDARVPRYPMLVPPFPPGWGASFGARSSRGLAHLCSDGHRRAPPVLGSTNSRRQPFSQST